MGYDKFSITFPSFISHIKKYHTIDGKPDNSIHEENGYYFKIDNDFINILNNIS